MKELLKKDWEYTLSENEKGYFLSVLCGTSAVFVVSFQLSKEESNNFLEQGETYISYLANQVMSNPEFYFDRRETPEK